MATSNSELWRAILENRSKSASTYFEELLTSKINIPDGIRGQAIVSHNSIRETLRGEFDRDITFPPVLKGADFLGGSFARHTKVRPLDDIDIYVPLDGSNLFYYEAGRIQPFNVNGENLSWNPLLGQRFAIGGWVSSSKVVSEVCSVLRRRFPQTKIKPDGQSVSLRMAYGQSSTSDGLGFDVVPCFSLSPQTQEGAPFYLIPDGRGGWIRTNPLTDALVADILQETHDKNFRKIVKVVKYWNSEFFNEKLNSYFIELVIARTLWSRSDSIKSLSFGVALAFWTLQKSALEGAQQSWITNAPAVNPGTLQAGDYLLLKAATDSACAAWDEEKAGRMSSAVMKWKQVFGQQFASS